MKDAQKVNLIPFCGISYFLLEFSKGRFLCLKKFWDRLNLKLHFIPNLCSDKVFLKQKFLQTDLKSV
ncbi:hypothetical protein DLM75_15025 [Leptospira stimsonii]|uniref:Uncharacterized protein n=1 Tax=Leptospira stimsonii TaxID=2202203 RepID=A0A396Z4U8_9LEPT|nr:hypothetical protein DLM75_15025 [Leptospira stimsonii]